MIKLHRHIHTGNTVLIAPEHIVRTSEHTFKKENSDDTYNRTSLTLVNGDSYTDIVESPLDIARLRAAWERRYDACHLGERITGELPIAVAMGTGGITLIYCIHTHNANEKAATAKPQEPARD